ncbi:MAG: hypothetical protein ACXVAN_15220 [Polyangia bacterium]
MRLHRPLQRVRRRLRLQAAIEGGALAAVVAAAVGLVGVYLWRLHLYGARGLLAVGLTALGVVLAGVVARALGHIPLDRAALQIDQSHGLHDRLRSALAFSAEPAPTPFMQAAVADAEAAANGVDARKAAPLERPDALVPAAILIGATALIALLQFPSCARVMPSVAARPPHLVVDRSVLDPELQAARALEAEAKKSGDVEAEALAKELNQLLSNIDAEELTRKQAFDKLAELENKYLHADDGELEYLKDKLRKAGTEMSKSKLLKESGKALEEVDVAQARKELEKLAAQAEKLDKKWDAQQRQEAAKQAEQDKQDKARADEEKRLKEEERQLRKQLAQKPNDEELQRRLERNQRELQRLEREKQERAEQQRELQRLQRELQKAAEQLRQKMSPEALKQLAQQMQKMENEISKLSSQSRAQMQIAEIKEVLRRAGKSSSGDGKQGMAQKDGKGKNQPGKGKGQGGKGEQLREFDARAGGKEPDTILLGENGQPSDSRMLLPLPMGPNGNEKGPHGDGEEQRGPGGDGIGDQHDANLMGDATRMSAEHHDTRVQGKQGAGPSRSQTILGSAEKGFASTSYKRVYGDYTAVVEEVMSKEKVPPGYRFYIKRYFQLIKPRE